MRQDLIKATEPRRRLYTPVTARRSSRRVLRLLFLVTCNTPLPLAMLIYLRRYEGKDFSGRRRGCEKFRRTLRAPSPATTPGRSLLLQRKRRFNNSGLSRRSSTTSLVPAAAFPLFNPKLAFIRDPSCTYIPILLCIIRPQVHHARIRRLSRDLYRFR